VIYLDHAATTPLGNAAREAMAPWLSGRFGNPSSLHAAGRQAREAVEGARETVARCLGASREEIVFTSGGTEADNLAVSGIPGPLAVPAVEHPAVLEPAKARGALLLPVDAEGRVDPASLPAGLALLSVMLVNNEVGTIQPVSGLARKGMLLHTDAVQAVGKIPVDVRALGVDLLSLSSHKVQGPQGVGALYVRRGVALLPRTLGGGQENGLRSGTENVAGIVGFAAALEAACRGLAPDMTRVAGLRDRLQAGILKALSGVRVNAGKAERAPHILSLCVEGVDGEAALMRLDEEGICASSGSACATDSAEPSHVLVAMGVPRPLMKGALRFSLGRDTTQAEIDRTVQVLTKTIDDLRALTPGKR
jgi:cysteine desulfurase